MIVFLTLCYVAVLALLVKLKIVRLTLWWKLSPLSVAENVTTPTLILHSEDDWRCPIEQAEQYFMALLRNGTSTELIRFPGEGHEMSRGGKPKHRQERFEAILDWHSRYLV